MGSQITIRLSEALRRRLEHAAKSLGRQSELARLTLNRYLDEIEEKLAPPPTARVRDLLRFPDSGVSDLGSRHREHLLAYFHRRGRCPFRIVP